MVTPQSTTKIPLTTEVPTNTEVPRIIDGVTYPSHWAYLIAAQHARDAAGKKAQPKKTQPKTKPKKTQPKTKPSADTRDITNAQADVVRCQQVLQTFLLGGEKGTAKTQAGAALTTALQALAAAKESAKVDKAAAAAAAAAKEAKEAKKAKKEADQVTKKAKKEAA